MVNRPPHHSENEVNPCDWGFFVDLENKEVAETLFTSTSYYSKLRKYEAKKTLQENEYIDLPNKRFISLMFLGSSAICLGSCIVASIICCNIL